MFVHLLMFLAISCWITLVSLIRVPLLQPLQNCDDVFSLQPPVLLHRQIATIAPPVLLQMLMPTFRVICRITAIDGQLPIVFIPLQWQCQCYHLLNCRRCVRIWRLAVRLGVTLLQMRETTRIYQRPLRVEMVLEFTCRLLNFCSWATIVVRTPGGSEVDRPHN